MHRFLKKVVLSFSSKFYFLLFFSSFFYLLHLLNRWFNNSLHLLLFKQQ